MKKPVGEIMGEIAYLDFLLRQMYAEESKQKSPIELMVDEACGLPVLKLKKAKKLIARIKKLQGML